MSPHLTTTSDHNRTPSPHATTPYHHSLPPPPWLPGEAIHQPTTGLRDHDRGRPRGGRDDDEPHPNDSQLERGGNVEKVRKQTNSGSLFYNQNKNGHSNNAHHLPPPTITIPCHHSLSPYHVTNLSLHLMPPPLTTLPGHHPLLPPLTTTSRHHLRPPSLGTILYNCRDTVPTARLQDLLDPADLY
jgi:hypothetical protein